MEYSINIYNQGYEDCEKKWREKINSLIKERYGDLDKDVVVKARGSGKTITTLIRTEGYEVLKELLRDEH